MDEPEIEIDEIQGNAFPGFKKDHQHFLFFRVGAAAAARPFLADLAGRVTTARQALLAHLLWKDMRASRGREPGGALRILMVNVAFTVDGLGQFVDAGDLGQFDDDPFAVGLAERAGLIGDPALPGQAGAPAAWLFGGSGASPRVDLLVILASDDLAAVEAEAARIGASARACGLTEVHRDRGAVRPGAQAGHEPFGFKDGISEPAIRGRWPGQDRPVVERTFPPDPAYDGVRASFASPGRPLVAPGHFILGYPRQGRNDPDAAVDPVPGPAWARNGSFLVYRRLRQDTAGFRAFLADTAAALSTAARPVDAAWVGSRLVGRWPGGAPIMRSPDRDRPFDDGPDNDFTFKEEGGVAPPGDLAPRNPADPEGLLCPFGAHIRKVNPRDDDTDQGPPSATLGKLLLRRGIAYDETRAATAPNDEGLLFVAYQASIAEQFEFVMRGWANQPDKPRGGRNFDPILGAGPGRSLDLRVGDRVATVALPRAFVTATGGAYLFAPSVSQLRAMGGGAGDLVA